MFLADAVELAEQLVEDGDDALAALVDHGVEVADVAEKNGQLARVVCGERLWVSRGPPDGSCVLILSHTNFGISIESFSVERLICVLSSLIDRKFILQVASYWLSPAYLLVHQDLHERDGHQVRSHRADVAES